MHAELLRLETELFAGSAADFARLEALVSSIRSDDDPVLTARTLSLASRAQIARGEHERAMATATQALAIFGGLDSPTALACSGPHAEALRAIGNIELKYGRVDRALPRLEEAVAVAQAGVDAPATGDAPYSAISALSALIRSLITLGAALFATRESDTAIALYSRVLAVADAHAEAYECNPDDVMIAHWNLTDTLHERVGNRRSLGDETGAQEALASAERILDMAAVRVASSLDGKLAPIHPAGRPLSSYGLEGYYGSQGRHLLLTGRPAEALELFERQLTEIHRHHFIHQGSVATAQIGLAQSKLDLGSPADALEHSGLALAALDEHDEATERAAALLVRSAALRALGRHAEAYETLERHYAVRSRLDAVAANQYASLTTARLGLERARADAEAHRRVAEMLETLDRAAQEITATLNPDDVCRILQWHARRLLEAHGFAVWLLDAAGAILSLRYGSEDDRELIALPIALDDPIARVARVARERREIAGDAPTPNALRMPGTRQMRIAYAVPLVAAERLLGVVSIRSDRSTPYTENERLIFRTLCTYGAIALDNAAAYTKLEQTVQTLQATQAELATRTAEYERLSMTDPLTGLGNRRHLHERAAIEIAERRRKGSQLAVAMFDIDHFKSVNDTYGHAVGDIVLQVVARVAKDWLRPKDFIARVGGEEFALLLPGAGIWEAVSIAERIRSSIAETPVVSGASTVEVTASFGVASFDATVDTLDRALNRADAALYAAKLGGRNRVHLGEPGN